eukprot:5920108-Alexandrium_andersonii.AAC.1
MSSPKLLLRGADVPTYSAPLLAASAGSIDFHLIAISDRGSGSKSSSRRLQADRQTTQEQTARNGFRPGLDTENLRTRHDDSDPGAGEDA